MKLAWWLLLWLAAFTPPPDVPPSWKTVIGDYKESDQLFSILERDGKLMEWRNGTYREISWKEANALRAKGTPATPRGMATFRVKPLRPVAKLRREALQATPPAEQGDFRKPDLVQLAELDSSIRLEIRYASRNDFLHTPVYRQAKAFLQRPAAEALLRVQQDLRQEGFGLLIYDAYRPWYVTKIFWDAVPDADHIFVADPKEGSRHNRGCAVDLTLYDLRTGKTVEMTGGYDEMSARSFSAYAGGTSRQRGYRDLLRQKMEQGGFAVLPAEWWHFDYKDWPHYAIQNWKWDQ